MNSTIPADFHRYLDDIRFQMKSSSGERRLMIGWAFLEKMGLDEFIGCDIDIASLIEGLPPDVEYIDVQSYLQHALVETLYERLESGWSSLFLDTEKMKGSPAEVLIPIIERQRENELAKTHVEILGREYIQYDVYMNEGQREFVPASENPVALENLWLTAIGCDVLSDLGLGLTTDMRGLKQVRKLLKKHGFDLKVLKGPSNATSPTKMTPELRSLVLQRTRSMSIN